MAIREMSREECLQVLAGARLARLACAHENQPYVVPVYISYHEASGCLYGFTTPGQKVEWMRINPLVCVEVDNIAAYDQWVSVIAMGRYEELPETPGSEDTRLRAPKRPQNVAEAMLAWSAGSHQRQCDTEVCDDERERAWQILQALPEWWQPASTAWAARAHRNPAEPFISVYYRIRIDRVTGHEASRDARDAGSSAVPAPPAARVADAVWCKRDTKTI
jgi:nitroimidazol reductase NimA-like FMN-containing flavoprotein (pyridoxamine 5'-phosphate oxidase superfamily)